MKDFDLIGNIPIIPNGKNITKKDSRLRKNIVHKSYSSRDHHLDIQYHLLREEFIRPLGEDINKYYKILEGNSPKFSPTIFHDVTIFSPTLFHDELVWCARFPSSSLDEIGQNTGRLQDGNLACLSSDNFKNEFLPAVILEKKIITADVHFALKFINHDGKIKSLEECGFDPTKKFVIIQSSSFFESCIYTLTALKETNQIPLENYIIDCKVGNYQSRFPKYFANSKYPYKLDFSVLFKDSNKSPRFMDIRSFPNDPQLGLHLGQFNALKGSLANKLTLIQGPPGTGKTFLGCKIMKLLLHNAAINLVPVPILVLCYTNHALDQFMTEIVKFHDKNVVRVGGGCDTEALDKFKLNELKRKKRTKNTSDLLGRHYKCKKPIMKRVSLLESWDSKIILPSNLSKVVPKNLMKQFQQPFGRSVAIRSCKSATVNCLDPLVKLLSVIFIQDDEKIFSWLGKNQLSIKIMETCSYILEETLLKWCSPLMQDYTATQIINAIQQIGKMDREIILDHLKKNTGLSTAKNDVHLIEDVVGDFLKTEKSTFLGIQTKCAAYVIDAHLIKDGVDRLFTVKNWIDEKREKRKNGGKAFNPERPEEVEIHEIISKERKRYFQTMKKNIAARKGGGMISDKEEKAISSIWSISLQDRWRLYRTWVERLSKLMLEEVFESEEDFIESSRKVVDIKDDESVKILKNADVIGMTITGAVKNRHIVDELNVKIVVVEEAAEILEAHSVMSLPKSTEHLLLIGDHQQLRPTTNVYDLSRNYNFDISLFERLVKNKIPFFQLTSQHRMRPEIADLLRLDIYRKLVDGENVKHYDSVKGMKKKGSLDDNNLFFIKHTYEESADDGTSKTNEHEARFLCRLCKHLIYQGYQPREITILSAYRGQVRLFADILPTYNLQGVKSTTIDNYQGEENEIILLSMVRSNKEKNIGFLKTINRVCVALSRAKKGFYCIGDFDKIRKKAKFWEKIVNHLESQKAIGEKLYLHCVKHPQYNKCVKKEEDFDYFPEGGCNKNCNEKLTCGHNCHRKCHPTGHDNYKCQVRSLKKFEKCNHHVQMPCFEKLKKKRCSECENSQEFLISDKRNKSSQNSHNVARSVGGKTVNRTTSLKPKPANGKLALSRSNLGNCKLCSSNSSTAIQKVKTDHQRRRRSHRKSVVAKD